MLLHTKRNNKRRRLFFVRLSIILFFLLVLVFGLAILSGHEKVTIKTFLVSGNGSVSSNDILDIANKNITGRYFGLFSRSNSLIFPRFKIATALLTEIKTLSTVDISWIDWQTVSIVVVEKKPHSVWCGEKRSTLNEICHFVDRTGYVFSPAPTFSGNLFVKVYGSLNKENYLSQKVYSEIFNLVQLLDHQNLEVVAVSFDGFDFSFFLLGGPEIIFNDKEGGFDVAFQNLFTAIESKDLDLQNDADKIKYIDLRFSNKIVVGKKGE